MDINVALGDRSYVVECALGGPEGVADALLARFAVAKVAIISDTTVFSLYGERVSAAFVAHGVTVRAVIFPAGEANKTVETWAEVVDGLLDQGVDRQTVVVALGGGVVGDLAGFAAATLLRGLRLVQVPTTLLSMVDSSVGGKTAVNHPSGKNLIGAFHQPSFVFVGMGALHTLPAREVAAGFGEVVKTALLGDPALLQNLEQSVETLRQRDPEVLLPVVARCIAIKAHIVSLDEREQHERLWLNLGHTVGHGVEAALGFGTLLHGEAVGLGLIAELAWALRAGVGGQVGLADRVAALLGRLGLPTKTPPIEAERVLSAIRLDKKAVGAKIRVPVCVSPGQMRLVDVESAHLSNLLVDLP